jgi:hypothetical protein
MHRTPEQEKAMEAKKKKQRREAELKKREHTTTRAGRGDRWGAGVEK